MFRELDGQTVSMVEVRDAILGLAHSENVVVIRQGLKRFSRAKWIEILRDECGLGLDRRHFDAVTSGLEPADWWEVSYQPDKATAYAHSKTRQPLHTDNAWFADPAEVNFFIMEKQAVAGGEQMIYPASRLIQDLSDHEPQLFRELCTEAVVIQKGGYQYPNRTTIIALDGGPRLFWNYYRVEKPTAEIHRMCDAFFHFLERRESTSSVERLHCSSGDCFTFNDLKMLHGRAAFVASAAYDRVLMQSMWKIL